MMEILNGLSLIPILGGILLFIAIVLIVVGVGALASEFEFMQRRLAGPRTAALTAGPAEPRSILIEDNLLKRIDTLVTPKNLDELSRIRRRLVQAGYRKPSAIRVYYLAKAVLALGFAVVAAMLLPFMAGAV